MSIITRPLSRSSCDIVDRSQRMKNASSGFVPMKALPQDHWLGEEGNRRVMGRHSRQILSLGDEVEARLREANAATGSLVFELLLGGAPAPIRGRKRRKT